MKRFYVDTNIWLDFALDRRDGVRPLGELSFQFFKKCIRNRWRLLYSDIVLKELGKELTKEEIWQRCFKIVSDENLLVKATASIEQEKEAERLSVQQKVPFADAAHAIIARDNNAAVVSRDAHFANLFNTVKCFLPEEP